MDNLTHSLVGWALAETGLKRRTRKGLPACVLAANMPDIDVFFGWAPWAPLAMHRGFTHGLVGGVLLMPPLLAGLLWSLDRWQASRGTVFKSGLAMHFGWLLALCYLGAITHPLLDLQNTYSVQLLSPLNTRWFHTDGLFIVSPWLLAMLGAGIGFARRRSRGFRPAAGRPAQAALAASVVFITLNVGISALAWSGIPDGARADRVFASPEPLLFWRRDVVWRRDGRIAQGRYDPLRPGSKVTDVVPLGDDNMGDPLVRKAIAGSPEIADFLDWSQMPFARIERRDCEVRVTFGDARFAGPRLAGSFTHLAIVPMPGPRCSPR